MNTNDNINKTSFSYKKIIIAVISLCILLYLLYKYYIKNHLEQMAPITKKLLNYLEDDDNINNNINNNNTSNSNTSTSLNVNNFPSYNTFSQNPPSEPPSLPRFANDYCRTSPNIIYTSTNNNINKHTFSLTNIKHTFTCNFERIDANTNTKQTISSIMTLIPFDISNTIIDIANPKISKSYSQFLISLSKHLHNHIVEYLHFVFVNKQNILIKIIPLYKQSLQNIIKTQHKKSLTQIQIIDFAWQLIYALFILHKNGIYHLHIHSGNLLINEDNVLLINDLENVVFSNFKHKREEYLEYVYQYYMWRQKEQNSNMFVDENKNEMSLYEVIDIVSYGAVLYEMIIGDTMKNSKLSGDDLKTLGYFNYDVELLMKRIFPVNGICNINAKEICSMNIFKKYNSNFKEYSVLNESIFEEHNSIIKLIYNNDMLLYNKTYI